MSYFEALFKGLAWFLVIIFISIAWCFGKYLFNLVFEYMGKNDGKK